MKFSLVPLTPEDRSAVVRIFNHYVENSFAAFPEERLSDSFFDWVLGMAKGFPALAVKNEKGAVIGFGLLRTHSPVATLSRTAEISYFIDPAHTGKGIGTALLERLVREAKSMGLASILACVSSLNEGSLAFHRKNGFVEAGRFREIGLKKGKIFDVVWMQKML